MAESTQPITIEIEIQPPAPEPEQWRLMLFRPASRSWRAATPADLAALPDDVLVDAQLVRQADMDLIVAKWKDEEQTWKAREAELLRVVDAAQAWAKKAAPNGLGLDSACAGEAAQKVRQAQGLEPMASPKTPATRKRYCGQCDFWKLRGFATAVCALAGGSREGQARESFDVACSNFTPVVTQPKTSAARRTENEREMKELE